MNTTYKYDPEDIESLLMHKQFHELYPEEKEFVLRHVEGPDEYESLRQTLFLMHDSADRDEWLEPDPEIKKALMAEFAREEKKGFMIWLNSLFAMPSMPEVTWYRRPAFRVALASVAILFIAGATWIYMGKNDSTEMAAVTSKEGSAGTDNNATDSSNLEATKEVRTYADNLKPDQFPPAPAPVGVEMVTTSVTQEESVVTYSYTPTTDASYSLDIAEAPAEPNLGGFVSTTDDVDSESFVEEKASSVKFGADKAVVAKELKKKNEDTKDLAEAEVEDEKTGDTLREDLAGTFSDNVTSGSVQPTATVVQYTSPSVTNCSAPSLSTISIESAQPAWYFSPTVSRNSSDMKDVLSVLFTAK